MTTPKISSCVNHLCSQDEISIITLIKVSVVVLVMFSSDGEMLRATIKEMQWAVKMKDLFVELIDTLVTITQFNIEYAKQHNIPSPMDEISPPPEQNTR